MGEAPYRFHFWKRGAGKLNYCIEIWLFNQVNLIPEEVYTYIIMKSFILNTLDKYNSLSNTEKKVVQCTALATGIVAGACTIKAIGATTLVGKAGSYLTGAVVAGVTANATTIGATHAVTKAKEIELFNSL